MASLLKTSVLFACLARCFQAQQIVNGQIYTPGIAIVDAPQPNTPLGGDYLQVALDVTSDGQISLPPYGSNPISEIYNITLFLSSYTTGYNFTISNGTATAGNASLGEIMLQEPSSTVKHVNWIWPDCLVGDGTPDSKSSARGAYNISIRQNFRLNGTNAYTIFDLPIEVTNSISASSNRPSCDLINNPLLSQAELTVSANNFTRIAGTGIQTETSSEGGLGGAGIVDWRTAVHGIWIVAFIVMFTL